MKLIIKEGKARQHPNWTMPSFEDEEGEFGRYKFTKEQLNLIKNSFLPQNIVELNKSVWKKLNNTDSWQISSIDDAIALAKEYGKNYESIMKAFETGRALPCPIVLKDKGKYELIAGNTRLMLAKCMNIVPKVLMIKL